MQALAYIGEDTKYEIESQYKEKYKEGSEICRLIDGNWCPGTAVQVSRTRVYFRFHEEVKRKYSPPPGNDFFSQLLRFAGGNKPVYVTYTPAQVCSLPIGSKSIRLRSDT